MDADLLSHEATFSGEMRDKAAIAKHSTASMAGAFARRLRARQLVLTHFSGRYIDRREARPRRTRRRPGLVHSWRRWSAGRPEY